MIGLARTFWRSLSGGFQWRLLWLFNAKFSVGVSAVVVDPDGRILLLRHTFRRTDGWSLPSGWMQAGERVGDAIVREIREETGLEAAPVTIFAVRSGFRLRVGFFLLCTVPAPGPNIAVDGREVLEAGFFAPGALPDSDRAAIDEALAALRRDPPPLL
jgi:ADP-ribose pyrophosphatase YjhB (NUDIX family)